MSNMLIHSPDQHWINFSEGATNHRLWRRQRSKEWSWRQGINWCHRQGCRRGWRELSRAGRCHNAGSQLGCPSCLDTGLLLMPLKLTLKLPVDILLNVFMGSCCWDLKDVMEIDHAQCVFPSFGFPNGQVINSSASEPAQFCFSISTKLTRS